MTICACFSRLRLAVALAVSALPMAAQIPYKACDVPPPGIKRFVIEHVEPITAFNSTLTPDFPAELIGQILSGAKVIHRRSMYNGEDGQLHNDLFLTDPEAPIPTPNYDSSKRVAWINTAIDRITYPCKPYPAIAIHGTILDGYPLYGDPAGADETFTWGWDPTNPSVIHDMGGVTAGILTVFITSAYIDITYNTVSSAIAGWPAMTTDYRELVLDGSQSRSTNGDVIYSWSAGQPGIEILDPTRPTTRVRIQGEPGEYKVSLATMNAAADKAISTITIRYTGGR